MALDEQSLILSIGADNFECEVTEGKTPFLLACIHWDAESKEQVEVLESISGNFKGTLRVGLLNEDFMDAFMEKYGIGGTPTYLIFHGGKEEDRLLGEAGEETMKTFILRNITSPKTTG